MKRFCVLDYDFKGEWVVFHVRVPKALYIEVHTFLDKMLDLWNDIVDNTKEGNL